jgi:hypothetical protein
LRAMTLDAVAFLRRFLHHILPKGFKRIRHYGFLANRCRRVKLSLCRRLLHNDGCDDSALPNPNEIVSSAEQPQDRCPLCHDGRMTVVEVIGPRGFDSS